MTALSEADFQHRVIDTAHLYGWRCVHLRAAKTAHGWRTPYQGDPGLPDLVLARRGVVRLAELKSDKGKPTADQLAWLEQAGQFGHLWRPRDWDDVLAILRGAA